MEKALVIAFSNLKHDARVWRQVIWLSRLMKVTVVCFDAVQAENIEVIKIKHTSLTLFRKSLIGVALAFRAYSLAYRLFHNYGFLLKQLQHESYSIIVANDIDTAPLAFELKKNAKLIIDAHEFAPRQFENVPIWRLFFQSFYVHLCSLYLKQAEAVLTVSDGLARAYQEQFQVKPVVITNAPDYRPILPSEVPENKIRLIHHGIVNTSRKIELMIELMDHLDERFELDLILMTNMYSSVKTQKYFEELKSFVRSKKTVKILPPLKSSEIVSTINRYDIGVYMIPPVNFNYANALPNKFFDFIQARLALAIGPLPEMANIVKQYDIGIVSESFSPESMAKILNELSPDDIMRFKKNTENAARHFNAGKNEQIFSEVVLKLLRI